MQRRVQEVSALSGGDLISLFTRTMLGYLLLMGGLWLVGLEGIYGHPTPFYALFSPALTSLADLRWQIPALLMAGTGLIILHRVILPLLLASEERSRKEAIRILSGIFVFAVLFAAAIAMIRDGLWGIEQAYNRQSYEYIGDIGKTRNIHQLFERYTDDNLFPYLSMHAKVHPPGPIALLWFLSYFVGNSPFSLSVATIVVSSLAIFIVFNIVSAVLFALSFGLFCFVLWLIFGGFFTHSTTVWDVLAVPMLLVIALIGYGIIVYTMVYFFDIEFGLARLAWVTLLGILVISAFLWVVSFNVFSYLYFCLWALGIYVVHWVGDGLIPFVTRWLDMITG